ncbi:hypothetical protein [Microlunatus parietis]|uniref:Uncharacterized protein n=1 Tax=Microlunatus parietis TaxID=682979 RepID=A0A7Y9IBX3_9ACTN|nr:hypothetical protein [Microlunatus parietis]NYE73885.1 hypothetical protein [Microlunatus parietis]
MSRVLILAGSVAVPVLLWACAPIASPGQPAVPASGGPSARTGPVTTGHPAMVLDDGSGAELCLGGVMESYPPQCSGPKLVGWDWSDRTGEFEEASGTRWGEFILTGRYDPAAGEFTPTEVASGRGYVWPEPEDDVWTSPCPEPAGGWRVTDTSKVSAGDLDAALSLAAALPDYSTAWMDQSPNPYADKDLKDEEKERRLNDPRYMVINVAVTGDLAAAEAKIREVWSGMLCVSRGGRTEAELLAVQDQLQGTPGLLSSSPDPRTGVVKAYVIHDDGSIQAALDRKFGAGLVLVDSALKPV